LSEVQVRDGEVAGPTSARACATPPEETGNLRKSDKISSDRDEGGTIRHCFNNPKIPEKNVI